MTGTRLYWIPKSSNIKTGDMPQAVVGATVEETYASCEGCDLRETKCYAWGAGHGSVRNFTLAKLREGLVRDSHRYTVEGTLAARSRSARYARVTSIGDPARADRHQLSRDVVKVTDAGLRILGYTHFWLDPENQVLRHEFMASCGDVAEADIALAMGWRATCVLPWHHYEANGPRFTTPMGSKGVVCPAQTKPSVTCNSCGLCSNAHQAAGRVPLIGFMDHSPKALKAKRWRDKHARTLPLFGEAS